MKVADTHGWSEEDANVDRVRGELRSNYYLFSINILLQ